MKTGFNIKNQNIGNNSDFCDYGKASESVKWLVKTTNERIYQFTALKIVK